MDQSSFDILAYNELRVHNLALVDHAYVKAHGVSEKQRVYEF